MAHVSMRLSNESRWISGVALMVVPATIGAMVAGGAIGVPVSGIYLQYVRITLALGLVAIALAAIPLMIIAFSGRAQRPLARFKVSLSQKVGTLDRAVGTLGPIVLMPILLSAYGTFKQLMPQIAPFVWDDTLAEIDRLLFFGYQPWQVTQAVFGSTVATQTIALIYGLWVPLLFFSVLGFSVFAPHYLRARFIVAFAGAWLLLGIVGAFLFSSAGPCYADLIGASSARGFAPMIAKMRATDANMFGWQDELWRAYSEKRYGFGYGISAMPSMHNAVAFLYVLSAARARPLVRLLARTFATVILVGSVHLGWHYLVDGLVAWAGVAGIWWLAGAYLRWCGYVQDDLPSKSNQTDGTGDCPEDLPKPLAA